VFAKPKRGIVGVGVSKSAFVRVAFCVSLLLLFCSTTFAQKTQWAFVASPVKGIFSYKFNAARVEVLEAGRAADFPRASFIALHPNGQYLYAVAEGADRKTSLVASFSIDAENGKLTPMSEVPSGGHGPCHIAVDPTGQAAMVANYSSGSFAAFPIKKSGAIGVMSALIQDKGSSLDPKRQEGPHAHCIICGPKSQWALGCDLGLDKVLVFKLNPNDATVTCNKPGSASVKPGTGPRHIALHPNNKFAYVINELDSTLTAFSWNATDGKLKELQNVSTLPKGFEGKNFPAEVAVHPNGKFVFGSNRGHDSIVVYSVDAKTGLLTLVGHSSCGGHWPRHFEIDMTGKLLLVANEQSDQTTIFKIDTATGTLTATGTTLALERPMCVKCIEAK
jgi:6-phosphogluconolactonase